MSISIAPHFTQRNYSWTNWKLVQQSKNFIHQYDDDGSIYTIWGYDGPEVHVCQIWKGEVPATILENSTITQVQNDLDKTDFEDNYLPSANQSLDKKAATGINGIAPAKGLGGFAPDPTNNPYQPAPDEVVSLYVDGEGSVMTRGAVLTDEGSLRDDFTGSSLVSNLTGTLHFTNGSDIITGSETLFTEEISRDNYIKLSTDGDAYWVSVVRAPNNNYLQLETPYEGSTGSGTGEKTRWLIDEISGSPGSISLDLSVATISSGTGSSGGYIIYRGGDYLPLISIWTISLSQRINNQTSFIGIRDNVQNPTMYCDILFDGTDNTKIKFRSAWNSDEELSTISLPAGLDTSQSLRYKIDVSIDYCTVMVNGVLIARHEKHIPDPYIEMHLCAGIINSGEVSNTTMGIDTVLFLNQDQVQISSNYTSPISVITKEDQHTISGKLTTSSTSADQVILSYTVPAGKVCYIIGYLVESSGTLSGNPVKIGCNSLTTEPAAPGVLDGNIFRSFVLSAGSSTGEVDFGGNPRKIGCGGDTIKITVSPSGLLSNIFRASLDFVLR